MRQVIIVGGGLAGLSAAHTVLEHGGRVLVLDKNPFLGGNSVKATSGLNGALTKTQISQGIADSTESFYNDTAKSARSLVRPELVKVLTGNSGKAVEWLQERFALDLSLVSRLGGHSYPRTHRGKERFPGMTITYALMEKLEEISTKEPHRATVLVKAKATKLLTSPDNKTVLGVQFEKDGKLYEEFGPVVVTTGGYAADFQSDSLLSLYRPDLLNLSTTNGDHCTGDGIKMASAAGANCVDMKMVQVHPTGLVDPHEPHAKVKFLAAEALRGVGGLLLDAEAQRFCDELGHRDYVTDQMWRNKGPFRLVLNGAGAKEIEWHCKHYAGRGLMRRFANGAELAKDMGVPAHVLEQTFTEYNAIAASGKDPFGKKYFQNLPFDMKDEFHVSLVTPVVHYCMGGLEVSPDAEVIGKSGIINGLYAAGEVAGGVHGENRLGGNSLLDCVVFGRVAGDTASRYLLHSVLAEKATGAAATPVAGTGAGTTGSKPHVSVSNSPFKFGAAISQPGVQTRVELEPNSKRLSLEILWDENGQQGHGNGNGNGQQIAIHKDFSSGSGSGSATPTPSPPHSPSSSHASAHVTEQRAASPAADQSSSAPSSSSSGGLPEFTLEEIAKHNTEKDCWVVINGKVVDVTGFLKDHPGGKKPILIYAGKDASTEFNMLHKPDVIEKYAPSTIIGTVKAEVAKADTGIDHAHPPKFHATSPSNVESRNSGGTADVLPMERGKASFDTEKMINFLDGGEAVTARKRWIRSPLTGVDLSDKYFWHSPAEALKQHVKHFVKVHETFWDNYMPTREDVAFMSEAAMLPGSLMNHYGLFLPTIVAHGTPEQMMWWAARALKMQIVGCYAQTELGHGSNVRGLMTTATYDHSTQEFVLNTPTLRSMKWWPGALGKVATHAVVYAQLIIDGTEYGVHSFMLQLRDENHKPLPGIELGDLGPKLGDHANDTGFMRLDNVRIPREFMLSKFQEVSVDGKYLVSESKKKNSKLHYSTMIFTRGAMVKTAGNYLARAVTTATRYSCVRKQGFVNSKDTTYRAEERAIIDYQVQRYRVFKQLALAYAIRFTGEWMKNKFKDLEGTAGGEGEGARGPRDRDLLANIDALPEIAATSAGLKALTTFLASQGIEDCRKCCGGNGYLLSSGVASLAADYVWQTTAEGDWIILMLQTARSLIKSYQDALQGKAVPGPVDYLEPLRVKPKGFSFAALPVPTGSFEDPRYLLKLFKHASLNAVVNVGEELQRRIASGAGFDDAWNSCAIDLCNAVRSHCFTFMLTNFIQSSEAAEDPTIKATLRQVCTLFALSNIIDDPQWVGVISGAAVQQAKKATIHVMEQIRPNAVALVDSFDIPDHVLNSTIGRYDGNIYEALYDSAQKSVLNQKDPFDGYEYIRPHLDLDFLKNGNQSLSKL